MRDFGMKEKKIFENIIISTKYFLGPQTIESNENE